MDDIQKEAARWVNKPYEAKHTWIFERGDGEIIYAEEAQAWELLHPRGEWQRRDFKLIGSSDFKEFKKEIENGKKDEEELKTQLDELRKEVRRYQDTFEKFKFEELLDDTDPKVMKVNEIIKKKSREIDKLKLRVENHKSDLYQRALKAEIERARGKTGMPENQDFLTPRGRRQEIMGQMKF